MVENVIMKNNLASFYDWLVIAFYTGSCIYFFKDLIAISDFIIISLLVFIYNRLSL